MNESNQQVVGRSIGKIRTLAFALKRTALSYPNWRNPWSAFRFFWEVQQRPRNAISKTRFYLGQLPFYVRPIDWFAFEEIILLHEYYFVTTCFQADSPEVVVDLGANVGLFSLYALSLWPSAQVHSLEAGSNTYKVLFCNKELNCEFDWHTYQYAIWERDGEIDFEDCVASSTSSRIARGQAAEAGKVPAITLDTFCSTHVDNPTISFVKMDIEGAEEAVLQSSVHLLGRIQNLVVEVHPARCDQGHVVSILRSSFEYLYQVPGRLSRKPMLLACRCHTPLPQCTLDPAGRT